MDFLHEIIEGIMRGKLKRREKNSNAAADDRGIEAQRKDVKNLLCSTTEDY